MESKLGSNQKTKDNGCNGSKLFWNQLITACKIVNSDSEKSKSSNKPFSCIFIRYAHRDFPVKPTSTTQCRIKRIRPVGCSYNHYLNIWVAVQVWKSKKTECYPSTVQVKKINSNSQQSNTCELSLVNGTDLSISFINLANHPCKSKAVTQFFVPCLWKLFLFWVW